MFLQSLGADSSVSNSFQPFAARGLELARVAVSQRDQYRLFTENGEVAAEASGALWHRTLDQAAMPVTGDWVAARIATPELAIIEAMLARKSVFSRRAAGRREEEQPVAANIDLVFLVCGLDADFNLRRLERYLTLAHEAGVEPAVVLNKADICADVEARVREAAEVARGKPVLTASAKTTGGIDALKPFLAHGRTVALLGSSGVGKSAIINALMGEDRIRTGAVRASDGRGQHTTTHRELIPLSGGGAVIDTPGMRELQLWAGADSVDRTFDDILDIASGCRFRNCSHSGEKDCAVADAIAHGVLSEERWESYSKLLAEARRHEAMADPLLAAEGKRRIKALMKGVRALYRERDR